MITEVHVSGIFKAIKLIKIEKKHLDSCACAEMRAPPFNKVPFNGNCTIENKNHFATLEKFVIALLQSFENAR